MKKVDLRVRRTLQSIEKAFLELLAKKQFQDITIQHVADAAMINWATFYSHYADKYELLDRLIYERLAALRDHFSPPRHVHGGTLYQKQFLFVIESVFTVVGQNADFFTPLLNQGGEGNVKERFAQTANTLFTEQFHILFGSNAVHLVPKEIFLPFLISAVTGTIFWWISAGQPYSPEEMAKYLIQIVTKGPAAVMGLSIEQ